MKMTFFWDAAPCSLAHIDRVSDVLSLQSTDHELISARNVSLAAMHGSAGGSNVRYYPT
jgi:hypothetical protein